MERVAFLAPQGSSTFGFVERDGDYWPHIDLAVPAVTRTISHQGCWIFVCRPDPAVHFFEPESGKRWSISLPAESRPFDLVVWRNWLFVAAGGKTLLAIPEWGAGTRWISLPCDKDVHALAVYQKTLIVIAQQKGLRHELTAEGAGELSSIELPHRSFETIEAAAYCNGKFATLSRMVNHGLFGKYVSVQCCSTFRELGRAGTYQVKPGLRYRFSFPPLKGARDIATYRDVLVIAADRYGLITTRMSPEQMSHSECYSNEYEGVLYDGFRQFWPDPVNRRPIVRVQACDEPAGFIVTSTGRSQDGKATPWEVAVTKMRTSATSLFLPYEQMSGLINSTPPGTIQAKPLRRAELPGETDKEK